MKTRKIILAAISVITLTLLVCACGREEKLTPPETLPAPTEIESETEDVFDVDVASLTWIKDELDCYGYANGDKEYYASFEYPESFQKSGYDDSGEQSRSYWAAPDGGSASESKYGIYAYFMQGGYGGNKATLEEMVVGGKLEERQLGGETILFGLMDDGTNPEASGYTYCYYLSYDEDDWSRIWIMLQDQEEDGLFRQTFEESLSFQKN